MPGPASADSHVKPLEIWFDYSSPWAYLGTTQVERVSREAGAAVVWRPLLLGAFFKQIGMPVVPIAAVSEAKRRYILDDLSRWADWWGVPFRFSSRFPLRTVKALRLTLLAPEDRRAPLVHRLMRACWVDDDEPDLDETMRACVADAGVDPALLGELASPEAKDALRRATDGAVARGIPGVPTFVVGDEIFWGQDRLDFVSRALQEEG